jgi:hypothetical protein
MFGAGCEVPGILIQCIPALQVNVTDKLQVGALRDRIWCVQFVGGYAGADKDIVRPVVESANATSPEFSWISKQMIIFTSADKPLPRSVIKSWMVARNAANQLYTREIADLYMSFQ